MDLTLPIPVLRSIITHSSQAQLLSIGWALRAHCIAWPPSLSCNRRRALMRLLKYAGQCYRTAPPYCPKNTTAPPRLSGRRRAAP
jgi:hypothetical protein